MTDILGISAYYHDSAAAILRDGQILAAAQQERFSRRKHDASFPAQAIEYCLAEAQRDLATIEGVVFDQDIAQVDTDAEVHRPLRREFGVLLSQLALNFCSAAHRIYHTAELGQN